MACCVLVAMIVARLRRVLGFGGAKRSGGPSLLLLLGFAAVEFGTAWALARGLTAPDSGAGFAHRHHDGGGSGSHLVLMAQLLLLGVLVPLALAWTLPARDSGRRPWARRQLIAATVAAPGVMWFWHLPAVHEQAGSTGWEIARGVSVLVSGYAFWRAVLGTGHRVAPAAARQLALVVAGQASALLGLALLLTTDAMHDGADGLGSLSAVADQRAAGLLMLAVDLLVTVPLLARLNSRRAAEVPASGSRTPATQSSSTPKNSLS